VVIYYLNIIGITILPGEAYSPLIVHTDTPLPFSVTGQFLQVICWWNTEKVYGGGAMNHRELSHGHTMNALLESRRVPSCKYLFRFLTFEGLYHLLP